MIRDIVKNEEFLKIKSTKASVEDMMIVQDLKDTLAFNHQRCVGMAANMIGFSKNIIIFQDKIGYKVMLNPEIIDKDGAYTTKEACLSLVGERSTLRFKKIVVKFQDIKMNWHTQKYEGYVAQIIQHEIDHLKGIII